jgi:glyoxylase-like metal-dependent hydrolase (beta-lactamase superfamily II)
MSIWNMQMNVTVKSFYHVPSGTGSYLVVEPVSRQAAVIDSVLGFDVGSGELSYTFADEMLAYLQEQDLNLVWILDTHAHADHLTAAHYLHQKTGAPTGIGSGIAKSQSHFNAIFNHHGVGAGEYAGFDILLDDGAVLPFGEGGVKVLSTPGHTPDSVSYLIGANIFVGDTLFMPDAGTARCDFPGGNAAMLWHSIEKLHSLPDATTIWVCHDYQPNGRELKLNTTVAESKRCNIHVANRSKQDYIDLRNNRDRKLSAPTLLYPSLQVNLWGGALPQKEQNGQRYIKIPLSQQRKN